MRADVYTLTAAILQALALTACTGGDPAPPEPTRPAEEPVADRPIDLSSLRGTIAFSAGAPHAEDVYVVNADGSGLRRVTSDPAADFDPTWSPDGTRIAYRHQVGEDLSTDIHVIRADGSADRNLTPNDDVADWGPAWSPDGSTIAFNSDHDTPGRLRGFVVDLDDRAVRLIPGDVWVEYPAWSPGGSRIAFMAQVPEEGLQYDIFVMDSDGTDVRRLTDSAGDDGWPSWSPDGTRILFSSIRDDCQYSDAADCKSTGDIGAYHTLYVMDADGSNETRVSDVFGQIADWSPDGRFIVFEDFLGRAALSVMRVDGSGLTTIEVGLRSPGFPDWIG